MKEKIINTIQADKFRKHMIIFIFLMSLVIVGYKIAGEIVNDLVDRRHMAQDNHSYTLQVDSVQEINKRLVLEGWSFKINENSEQNNIEVFLYSEKKDELIRMETETYRRQDVDSYFSCKYSYLQSGFLASIACKKMDLFGDAYEVLISFGRGEDIYHTGKYITENGLIHVKPSDLSEPDVDGTNLEEIVKKGILQLSFPQEGIFVYQYNDLVYWIYDKGYKYEEDGMTYTVYHARTTNAEQLPVHRVPYEYDNMDFYFEDNVSAYYSTDKYDVVVKQIPKSYPITYMATGHYNLETKEYLWFDFFRPIIQLQ